MLSPVGYSLYFRGHDREPSPADPPASRSAFDRNGRNQTLGLLLMSAVICVPVLVAGGLAFALKILA